MTVPSDEEYDPSVHLSVQDIAADDSKHPSVLRITIKQSKTDLFRKGGGPRSVQWQQCSVISV